MYYKVKIPEPCSEDWSKMAQTEKGRFCDSCEKEVIDFTRFSQREIALRIKNGERVCGRFRKDQLENPYFLPEENRFRNWKLVAGFSSLLGFCSPAFGQSIPNHFTNAKVSQNVPDQESTNQMLKDSISVTGTINEGDIPLPGASIVLEGTSVGTTSDFDGNFSLQIPSAYSDKNETIQIVISYVGFETKRYTLDRSKTENITIVMTPDESEPQEVIVVGGAISLSACKSKNKPLSRWFRWKR